jgi:hypothetical protein
VTTAGVDISRFKIKTVLVPSDAARTTVRMRRGSGETREIMKKEETGNENRKLQEVG